jgi:ribosome biogenesis protein UTP30
VSKIKTKYSQYEAQRQLLAEHDLFLADSRIITQLPKLLGKTFYKSSAKRPIPVDLAAERARSDGKKIAQAKGDDGEKDKVAEPKKFAREIEKTFNCALVALSPSVSTSVRVGTASMSADEIAANVTAVANELIEKFVVKKWRGVRGLHIKGPESAALPIWLADELWTDETDVLEDQTEESKAIEANTGKKRKALLSAEPVAEGESKKAKIEKAKKLAVVSEDANLDREIAARKEKLKAQKEAAAQESGEPVVEKKTKKAKKSKA